MIVIKNIVDQESEVTFDDVTVLIGTCDTLEECKTLIKEDFEEGDEYVLDWSDIENNSVKILCEEEEDNIMFEGGYVIL